MPTPRPNRLAVIGGGPAGLMAAEVALAGGLAVDLYDAMGSVGRKFLLAGKGGLNLTHSDPRPRFVSRYRERSAEVGAWLAEFDADAVRQWARDLGVETFVGSSGRVFPVDLKAAPLLRGWVRRLRERGLHMHMRHRWTGWDGQGSLRFETPDGTFLVQADAVVLALGGASWPQLGSDGAWAPLLEAAGIPVAPLRPANCGFDVGWSEHFATRHAGQPIKPVVIDYPGEQGARRQLQGEFVVTATGVEGSAIYALSARLRDAIANDGQVEIRLDLAPGRSVERLATELARPRGKRSLGEHLRRSVGLDGAKAGLVYEVVAKDVLAVPARLAAAIKSLPVVLRAPRPVQEAISTAGGVRFDGLDPALMLRQRPSVFCAGEMLDWEAPTGGYLLTAAVASGRIAARGALAWLARRPETGTAD